MSLKVKYKFTLDKSVDDKVWTMVYMYKPKSTDIFERLGELFAIISIKVEGEFDYKKASHHFLEIFHDTYFSNQEDDSITAIEKSIKEVKQQIFDYIKDLPEDKFSGMDINFGGISLWNDTAYFALLGEVGVFWFRDGNIADVNQLLNDETEEKSDVKIGSGELQDNDSFLLSYEYDIKKINKDNIAEIVGSDEKGIEKLFNGSKLNTGILISFKEGEKEKEIETNPEESLDNVKAENIVENKEVEEVSKTENLEEESKEESIEEQLEEKEKIELEKEPKERQKNNSTLDSLDDTELVKKK